MDFMRVSHRKIANVLLEGMPIHDKEYTQKVNEYIETLKHMPIEQFHVLQAAFIFSRKIAQEERQDLFQHLVAHILEIMSKWDKPITSTSGFCYKVARHEWMHFLRDKHRHIRMLNGSVLSLNVIVEDSEEGEIELQNCIGDGVNFESELNSKLDTQALIDTFPDRVKAIVHQRLNGQKISHLDYKVLNRYIKRNGDKIRELIKA